MVQVSRYQYVGLLAWFICASAQDLQIENDCAPINSTCETHKRSTILGHNVLLPCNFSKNHQIVSWMHPAEMAVVTVTSDGRVNFFDPRFGRVNAFPNQGSQGNYSISIDNVNSSDLGCYRCMMGDRCVQVELALKTETDDEGSGFPIYIYIVSGVATVILLSVGCYFCVKKLICASRVTVYNINAVGEDADAECHPIEELGREPGDGQPQSHHPQAPATRGNQIVYENADNDEPDYLNEQPQCRYMNQNEFSHGGQVNFVRVESKRTKKRFHTELINRLRQASIRKHQYVNQEEIRNQQDAVSSKGAENRKAKIYHQYPNPIYNKSTDHLNQM